MAAHPESTAAAVSGSEDRSFFGHPRGLSTLFFTELWERFSYYGMRALLILFMVAPVSNSGLGFPVSKAGAIYGVYTAMVFLASVPGGWIADRLTGHRRAVVYGGILITLGHICLSIPSVASFYLGLVFIVFGTGLLKPNTSIMVGNLYGENDHRRDGGYSIYYMGINIGAFLSPLVCGYLGEKVNWHYGFAVAAVGMMLGLTQYLLGARYLGSIGLKPAPAASPAAARAQRRQLLLACVPAGVLLIVLGVLSWSGALSITAEGVADAAGVFLILVTVGCFGWLFAAAGSWSSVERKRLVAVVVLFVAACAFWANYEQAGSTLNLFAERNTRLTLLGYSYPASWFQSLNPLFILVLAPFFAWLWVKLGPNDPSSPAKFAWGLILVGLGFAILVPVAHGGRVSPMWLLLCYLLQTAGELLLSPVGLSAVSKLAPERLASMMMGLWFLADSVGNYIGGRLASVYETFSLPLLFALVAGVTVAFGLVMLVLVPPVKKLMSGVN